MGLTVFLADHNHIHILIRMFGVVTIFFFSVYKKEKEKEEKKKILRRVGIPTYVSI